MDFLPLSFSIIKYCLVIQFKISDIIHDCTKLCDFLINEKKNQKLPFAKKLIINIYGNEKKKTSVKYRANHVLWILDL